MATEPTKIKTQEEWDALPERFEAHTEIHIVGKLKEVKKTPENCSVYVYDSARIGYVYGSARIDYVNGSASIDYVNGSARIGYVNGSARIGSVYDSAVVHIHGADVVVNLFAFSVAFMHVVAKKVAKRSKTAIKIKVTKPKTLADWIDLDGVAKTSRSVILYKRVSVDFKTQEGTRNETLWLVGSTVEHPRWSPAESECGEGKFHACSRAVFCDQYRHKSDDKYIAIRVARADLYFWKDGDHAHKIAFRKCVVLHECDKFEDKIEEA